MLIRLNLTKQNKKCVLITSYTITEDIQSISFRGKNKILIIATHNHKLFMNTSIVIL